MRFSARALLLVASLSALVAPARGDMISTTFASDNQFFGNMFDVTTFGNSLTVTALDVNIVSDANNTPVGVSLYTRSGTYVGNDTSSAGWNLVGTVTVTSQGEDNPTFVDVPDFNLASNSVTGFYVTVVNNGSFPFPPPFMRYTDGSNTFSNADIRLDLGEGVGPLFQGLGTAAPRTWNGTIVYNLTSVPEPSSVLLIGTGLVALVGPGAAGPGGEGPGKRTGVRSHPTDFPDPRGPRPTGAARDRSRQSPSRADSARSAGSGRGRGRRRGRSRSTPRPPLPRPIGRSPNAPSPGGRRRASSASSASG